MRPIARLASFLLLTTSAVVAFADAGTPAVVVERLTDPPVEGRKLLAFGKTELSLDTAKGPVAVKLDDVVEIAFATPADPPRAYGPREVAVDLWTGETVLGDLRGGDDQKIELDSALLGRVPISLERIAGVRFLQRLALAADPPDLRSRAEGDVLHLVGGDQFVATLERFTDKAVAAVTPQKDRREMPYDRLVAVRLMHTESGAPPESGVRLALRDGTRVVGPSLTLAGERITLQSASGFPVTCALSDVIATQVISPRFAYLSDLPFAKVEVKPVWDMVAGDPTLLYAPRTDQSFTGKPLRSGGRAWLDGIGVFAGTTLTYALDGKYREFRTHAGLDDGAGRLGGVLFKVMVDGKEAWNSGFVRAAGTQGRGHASPVASPRIPLEGAKTLQLVVLAGDDEDPYPVQDEADWLGALVVRAAGSEAR